MAKKQTTRETKKIKDKWKSKQWYSIYAPEMFNRAKIGETLSDDPAKMLGRTIEVTLQDLTGDFRMMHIKLRFRVVDHSTSDAFTRFVGLDLTSDYIRRQTRRKRTKMEGVFDVTTKDGYRVRLKPMAISDKRIQSSVQYLIRKRMETVIDEAGAGHTFSELTSMVLTPDKDKGLVNQILNQCRSVYPLKRMDIRKMEILSMPEGEDKTTNILSAPVPPEQEAKTEVKETPAPAEPVPVPEPTTKG